MQGEPAASVRIRRCPKKGVHPWVYAAAFACKHAGLTGAQAETLILARMARRPNPANEVETTVEKVYSGKASRGEYCWPEENRSLAREIIRHGWAPVAELCGASPVRFNKGESRTEEVIKQLFPGDPWLCCALSDHAFSTWRLSMWLRRQGWLNSMQLVVPSPMLRKWGTTQEGKQSQHTKDATGPRRFLVVEFDPTKWEDLSPQAQQLCGTKARYLAAKQDEHATILLHLGRFAPLVLVVHSGGKSLHGWFWVCDWPEEKARKFFAYAVALGADPATWTSSQFVRMPDGLRRDRDDKGNVIRTARQSVLFFNPQPLNKKEVRA